MADILAIVGSTYFNIDKHGYHVASDFIGEYLIQNLPDELVSGGADGIDELAVFWATGLEIPYQEFLPVNKRWEPDGYKSRNIQIVEACTRLIRISHHMASTYGSGWTTDYAERQRIPVERYLYNPYNKIEKL